MASSTNRFPEGYLQAGYQELRRHDRDRFVHLLLMPGDWRPVATVLLQLRLELARLRETVSEEMTGLIRLQWWRETLEAIGRGEPARAHPLAQAFAALYQCYPQLSLESVEGMITAREEDLRPEPPADLTALETYLEADLGGVYAAWVDAAQAPPAVREALGSVLKALGLAGIARATGYYLSHGKVWIPEDILQSAGYTPERLLQQPEDIHWPCVWKPLLDASAAHRQVAERLLPGLPAPWRRMLAGLLVLARRYEAPMRRVETLAGLERLPPAMTFPGMLELLLRQWR